MMIMNNMNSGLSTQCFCIVDHACITHSPLGQAWMIAPPFPVLPSSNEIFDFSESLPLTAHLTGSLLIDFIDDETFGFNNSSIALDLNSPDRGSSVVSPQSITQSAVTPTHNHNSLTRTIACRFPGCDLLFKRDYERNRHEDSVHLHVPGLYVCEVRGCRKNTDGGYKRADKLTEHMWRAHADMGFVKRG